MSERNAWLSLTPEPERELPGTVATLRAGGRASGRDVARERARIERLVVRARMRAWLTYLSEIVTLVQGSGASRDPDVERARAVALDVLHNHHQLLLGVPGRAARRTAGERSKLEAATREGQFSNGGQR